MVAGIEDPIIYMPRHRVFQKIPNWMDLKLVAIFVLLGICLIISSKAMYEINNMDQGNGNFESLQNITDKVVALKDEMENGKQWLYNELEYLKVKNCPKHWFEFQSTCFYISNSIEKTSWGDASKECKKLNEKADIAKTNNAEDHRFIIHGALGSPRHEDPLLWIGGIKKDGAWQWKDGTNMTKNIIEDITMIKKTNQDYNCLLLSMNNVPMNISLHPEVCTRKHQYVCSFVPPISCPAQWVAKDQKCYFFSTSQATWNVSRDHCNQFGDDSDLFTVKDVSELSFINKGNGVADPKEWGDEHWLGGFEDHDTGNFTWLDGTVIPKDSQYWRLRGEPSHDPRKKCLKGGFVDGHIDFIQANCEDKVHFICKKGQESSKGIDHHLNIIGSELVNISDTENIIKQRINELEGKYVDMNEKVAKNIKSMQEEITEILSKQVNTNESRLVGIK